jgi:hypothetical protein
VGPVVVVAAPVVVVAPVTVVGPVVPAAALEAQHLLRLSRILA